MHEPLEQIKGIVERVTFHSDETGFCVLRTKIKGERDLVTVVGNLISISTGESIEASGVWITDKKHGVQFKSEQLNVVMPTSVDGIEKYLSSGMVKGIGPHFARKLIQAFGADVFDVIEQQPEKLMALEGIGKKRKAMVLEAYGEQQSVRNIMLFLQTHGVGTARAVRIYKAYGDRAIEKVRENPYRLALDIYGVGFKTADTLALKLGIARDSILRAQAGIRHTLQGLCNNGHCAVEYANLVEASVNLLEIPAPTIEQAITDEARNGTIIIEKILNSYCIFPAALHHAETQAAEHLERILAGNPPWRDMDTDTLIPWVETQTHLKLSESQQRAVATVLQNKVSIITGGPGVGKTTIVHSILKILHAKKLNVMLCAPTGRAAKRLTETTGLIAKTIHRMLELDPQTFGFKHDDENPLATDVVVVDESSMIDITLFHHLLKAIPDNAAVIFVGDVDQLPSVGSGAVLSDLIRSECITTVKLTEIFRQAANSNIILNAHRINSGELPVPNADKNSDFFTIYVDSPEEIHAQLMSLIAERLPNYYNCNPLTDIQLLTPMNRGGLGSSALNVALQALLNGDAEPKITRFGVTIAPGDKVIQIINNYDKEVFNGDIGFVAHIDMVKSSVKINFDQRTLEYDFNELDEINLAYAISIHKSQGSEFPVVVMPLSTQHYALLARNLVYTGVTRGKKLVVLVAQKKALGLAIKNDQESKRLTKLAERLQEMGC